MLKSHTPRKTRQRWSKNGTGVKMREVRRDQGFFSLSLFLSLSLRRGSAFVKTASRAYGKGRRPKSVWWEALLLRPKESQRERERERERAREEDNDTPLSSTRLMLRPHLNEGERKMVLT
jgi:hypothetical protein